jgi:hypothetical protein
VVKALRFSGSRQRQIQAQIDIYRQLCGGAKQTRRRATSLQGNT